MAFTSSVCRRVVAAIPAAALALLMLAAAQPAEAFAEGSSASALRALLDSSSTAASSAASQASQTSSDTAVKEEVHATQVSLSQTSVVLLNGIQTAKVTGAVAPANCTDQISWSVGDAKVAKLGDDGTISTVGLGTTTITLTVGELSAACQVQVVQPVTQIDLNKATFSMEAGDTKSLTATVLPDNAYNKAVTWSSSNPAVAKVDSKGNVTGVAKGTATITCAAADGSGVKRSAQVEVVCDQKVVTKATDLASAHGYADSGCDTWVYTESGAAGLAVTFDKQTCVESGYDYIEVYAADGSMVGKYTGTELAGTTVKVPGDTVKIRLVSDASNGAWGFAVSGIKQYQPDGWSFFDGASHYYISGYMLRGECYVGGAWRYFDPDTGAMRTGLTTQADGTVKYYDENGMRVTGWAEFSEGTRYFDPDTGAMATGLTRLSDGRVIYCGTNGVLRSGTFTFKGVSLYFNDNGVLSDPATTDVATGTIAEEDGGPAAARCDVQELNRAVSRTYELTESDYTAASWSKMVAARDAALAVINDETLTQTVCDALASQLNAAIDALEAAQPTPEPAAVDTSWLQQVVSNADALNESDYTAASWAKLQGVEAAAKVVLADASATQTVVDGQAQLVQNAIEALEAATPEPDPEPSTTVDTTSLVNALNDATSLTEADYTADSWANLQSAVSAAQGVLADFNATQEDIDNQTQLVRDAIDALQPASTDGGSDGTDGGQGGDGGSDQGEQAGQTAEGDGADVAAQVNEGEMANDGAAAESDTSEQDQQGKQRAEYLAVLCMSAKIQAASDDPDGYQSAKDSGDLNSFYNPTVSGAYAGALIAQACNTGIFSSFLDAAGLGGDSLTDPDIQKNDDGSYSISADAAARLLSGVKPGVECHDASFAWGSGICLSEDGTFTVPANSTCSVDAEFADVSANDDGSYAFAVKVTVHRDGADDVVKYSYAEIVPSESSPFGYSVSSLPTGDDAQQEYAQYFE